MRTPVLALLLALVLSVFSTAACAQLTASQATVLLTRSEAGDMQAMDVLKQRAEHADLKAQFGLGLMYDSGKGVPQDYVEAAKWYRQAAEFGYIKAQINLGILYENGQGRKAANWRDPWGEYAVGLMYDKGHGVPQDYAEAVKWYQKAAAQGIVKAETSLGLLYAKGLGVPQNRVEAMKWYKKAAIEGDVQAQVNLQVMYREDDIAQSKEPRPVPWYSKITKLLGL